MSRRFSAFRSWRFFCAAFLALVAGGTCSSARADDVAALNKQIAAHLDAGEFPVARGLADKAVDAQVRDDLLAQIAAAQMFGGMRRNGINTIGRIGSDRVRTGSLAGAPQMFAGQSPGFAQPGLRGGGAIADFTELLDLIKKTTGLPKPGWIDDGGVGTVEPFTSGVFVDASGTLRRMSMDSGSVGLAKMRQSAAASNGNRNVHAKSALRMVSLTRLEKFVQMERALGHVPDDAMRNLAGLQRIQYVFVYPETGDIVIAGPAGDWGRDAEGRQVSADSGRPVLQLDDLIVLVRNAFGDSARFGCSIDPRKENLAAAQSYLAESAKRPLKPGQRDSWLAKLRDTMGKQDISIFGVDPRTRVARVIVEADYRMKMIGMGLEEGTLGVVSYLDSVQVDKDGHVPPMDVLRWWFTLNYDAVQATEGRDAFAFKGQGVKVMSENEMLNAKGERVHTGKSDELNSQFASSFTKHFAALAAKYPIYAELQNVFDLALVAALLRAEDLPGQTDWHLTYFGDSEICPVELGSAPKETDTIVNHRVFGGKHIVAGVSGGVSVDARSLVQTNSIKTDTYGLLKANRTGSAPKQKQLPANAWWWD